MSYEIKGSSISLKFTIKLFNDYMDYYKKQDDYNKINDFHLSEAAFKLQQVDLLLERIIKMEYCILFSMAVKTNKINKKERKVNIDYPTSPFKDENEFNVFCLANLSKKWNYEVLSLCESIYYLAFRIIKILHLISFKKFNPKGINIVRNHLYEHPKDKLYVSDIKWTKENGFQLKVNEMIFSKTKNETKKSTNILDQGIVNNFLEFKNSLESCLKNKMRL